MLDSGYAILPGVAPEVLASCLRLTAAPVRGGGTRRLFERVPGLETLLEELCRRASTWADQDMVLCRSILFDKTAKSNWKVGWHQDVTLACPQRFEREGWSNWSVKDGVPHVQPPVAVLEEMLTLRLHLDPCGQDNGPLRVLPGSHRSGRLNAREIQERVSQERAVDCLCQAGELLVMRPLLIHSSGSATRPGRRRVIHLEFCPTRAVPV